MRDDAKDAAPQEMSSLTEESLLKIMEDIMAMACPGGPLVAMSPIKIWFDGDKFQSRTVVHGEFWRLYT